MSANNCSLWRTSLDSDLNWRMRILTQRKSCHCTICGTRYWHACKCQKMSSFFESQCYEEIVNESIDCIIMGEIVWPAWHQVRKYGPQHQMTLTPLAYCMLFAKCSATKDRGSQPFAHHTPIFSNAGADAQYHRLFLVTMLFYIIGDLPGNIVKCK